MAKVPKSEKLGSWECLRPPVCDDCGRPATIRWRWRAPDGTTSYEYTCDRCQAAGGEPEPISHDRPRGLLTRAESADYLGVSVDAFDEYVKPHVRVRMIGSKPMFTPDALDDYAHSGAADL